MATVNHSAKHKSTASVEAAIYRRKSPSPSARKSQAAAMVVYRQRVKNGLQPIKKPWDYLTSHEVKKMAWQAYRVAAWYLRDDLFEVEGRFTHEQLREAFAESLAEMFKDALSAHAVTEGGCWPVDADTPHYRNYPKVWGMLAGDVPQSWRPERNVYPEVPK